MSRNGFRGVLVRCVVVASSSVKPGALFVKICTRDLHVFGVVWVHEFSFLCPRVSGRYHGKHMGA